MSNAARTAAETPPPLSAAQVDALNADIRAKMRGRVPPAAKPAATPGRGFGRMNLRVITDDGEPRARPAASEEPFFSPVEAHGGDPVVGLITESNALIVDLVADVQKHLERRLAGLQLENANLNGTVAELRAQVSELAFVSERLRIDNRGPAGLRGERGRDGRDGPSGARGERGEPGERGKPAPIISAWEVDPEGFAVVPVFATGERGVPICLLALFQSYDCAVNERDDLDAGVAAAASRRRNEEEIEARHWAK